MLHAVFRIIIVAGSFLALMMFSYISMHVKPGDSWYELDGLAIRDDIFERTRGLNEYFVKTKANNWKISAFMIFCGL